MKKQLKYHYMLHDPITGMPYTFSMIDDVDFLLRRAKEAEDQGIDVWDYKEENLLEKIFEPTPGRTYHFVKDDRGNFKVLDNIPKDDVCTCDRCSKCGGRIE